MTAGELGRLRGIESRLQELSSFDDMLVRRVRFYELVGEAGESAGVAATSSIARAILTGVVDSPT